MLVSDLQTLEVYSISDLKTLEVHIILGSENLEIIVCSSLTIFGIENPGSVNDSQDLKPWIGILSVSCLIGLNFDAIQSEGPVSEAPGTQGLEHLAPHLSESSVSQFSTICYYLPLFTTTTTDDCYDHVVFKSCVPGMPLSRVAVV